MTTRYRLPSKLFQSSPLLSTESKDHRDQIRDGFDEEMKPQGIVECMYVAEISDMSWETLRLRRCRTAIIALAFRLALEKLLAELLRQPGQYAHDVRNEAQNLAHGWFFDEAIKRQVRELLRQFHLDESAIEAEAFRTAAADLELIDKLLASLESRRNRALRSIAEYRADLAERLAASSKRVLDGEVLAVEHAKHRQPPAAT